MQIGQRYVAHKVALAVSRSFHVPGGTIPSFNDYEEKRNIIFKFPVAEITIQEVLVFEEFESNTAIKNSLVVIERKGEEKVVL